MKILLVSFVALASASSGAQENKLEEIRAFLPISERLATSGQIEYNEIPAIKDAGYEVVVNLAPASKERNGEEGFRVTEQGMAYVQIPVDWENPSPRDFDLFAGVMKANQDRKVYVHCFANMRVSVFVYLYRTLELGVPREQARADLGKIWDPATEPQWARFIEEIESKR